MFIMSSELNKFCSYNKTQLQRNAFSKRFNRGKTFNGNLYLCFICLTNSIYCSSWKFEIIHNQLGKYDRRNSRYSKVQLRSSLTAIRDHVKTEHKPLLANHTNTIEQCYVNLTPEIDTCIWKTDQENKLKKTNESNERKAKQIVFTSSQSTETDVDSSFNSISSPPVGAMLFDDIGQSSPELRVSHAVFTSPQTAETDVDCSFNSISSPLVGAMLFDDIETSPMLCSNLLLESQHAIPLRHSMGLEEMRNHITSNKPMHNKRARHDDDFGYSSDEDDEVVYCNSSELSSCLSGTQLSSCCTPVTVGLTLAPHSDLDAHHYITDSGTIFKARNSKRFLTETFEPSYFKETVDCSTVVVNSPVPIRHMPMNEHYSRLDYDYVASPIDTTKPLVTYGGIHEFRDFRDESETPQRVVRCSLKPFNICSTSPLFPRSKVLNATQTKEKRRKQLLTIHDYDASVKSLVNMIMLNKQLVKYRPVVTQYAELNSMLAADCKILTDKLSVCVDKKKRGALDSRKDANKYNFINC